MRWDLGAAPSGGHRRLCTSGARALISQLFSHNYDCLSQFTIVTLSRNCELFSCNRDYFFVNVSHRFATFSHFHFFELQHDITSSQRVVIVCTQLWLFSLILSRISSSQSTAFCVFVDKIPVSAPFRHWLFSSFLMITCVFISSRD